MGACDNCRARKVKCESLELECKRCKQLKLKCTYNYITKKERSCEDCKVKKRYCDKKKPSCGFCFKVGRRCYYLEPNLTFSEHLKKAGRNLDFKWKLCYQIKPLPNFGEHTTVVTVTAPNNIPSNIIYSLDPNVNNQANNQTYSDSFRLTYLTFINQFVYPTIDKMIKKSSPTNRNFYLTDVLINHLIDLFYFNAGAYHPIVPRAYLNYLLLYRPKENSTLLLLYSICLAASNNFEALPLCPVLIDVFSKKIAKLYKLCYTKSNLPLIMVNVLLSLVSSKNINNSNIFSQKYYHFQAVRIAHQLGAHLESSKFSDIRNEICCRIYHTVCFHDIFFLRQFSDYEPYLHNFFVPRDPKFCIQIDSYTLKYTPLAPELVVSHYQPHLVLKSQLKFVGISSKVEKLNARHLAYVQKCKQSKTSPNLSRLSSENLTLERELHQSFFLIPLTQGLMPLNPNILEVPEDPALVQSFFLYMSLLTDIYRRYIKLADEESLYNYNFSQKQIELFSFINLGWEIKVIIAALFATNAIIKHQEHFMNSSVFYKSIAVLAILLFIEQIIKALLAFKRRPPVVDKLLSNYRQMVTVLNNYKLRFPVLETILSSINMLL